MELRSTDGCPAKPWLDLADAWVDINANGVFDPPLERVSGRDVVVSYTGWSEADAAYVTVPDPSLAIARERHQVPIGRGLAQGLGNKNGFGLSKSAVAVGHNSVVLGTEGAWDPGTGAFISADGLREPSATLLSVLWDPVRKYVKGFLDKITAPLGLGPSGPQVAVPTGAAAVSDDGVVLGAQARTSGGPTMAPVVGGYVSQMRPARTLICDNTRLVETVGARRVWVCTGSRVSNFGETGPEGYITRPFNRPAKATVLPRSNTILVVDTGNNRVIEIDRDGNQLWPLDANGFDYYTSPANYNLHLSEPADAYRYVDPATGETHTVIADTGNYRVIDVITTYLPSGGQSHAVLALTPSYAKFAGIARPQRVKYTRAQPIWDTMPGLGGNRMVIGYLCAASNLQQLIIVEAGSKRINPAPTDITPSAAAGIPGAMPTWAPWTWIYCDAGPDTIFGTADDRYNPLLFANIRHVEYFWQGDTIYVCVVASQYRGRAMAIPSPTASVISEDGVFEWSMTYSGGAWGLVDGGGPDGMSFVFTASHYDYLPGPDGTYGAIPNANGQYLTGDELLRPLATIYTPSGAAYPKRFYPVCAKRLLSGNYLITNYAAMTENLTHTNLDNLSPATSLSSEVFEVIPGTSGPPGADPTIDNFRVIPDPWDDDWPEPLNQPTYAERY